MVGVGVFVISRGGVASLAVGDDAAILPAPQAAIRQAKQVVLTIAANRAVQRDDFVIAIQFSLKGLPESLCSGSIQNPE